MLRQLFWMFVLMVGLLGISDSVNRDDSDVDQGISAPSGPSIQPRDGEKCCDPGPTPGCDPCNGG